MLVHSLYDGILPDGVLEAAWKKGNLNRDTAKHVYTEVWVQYDTVAIVYYVPDYAEFVLFRIAFLPVLVGHSKACVRVGSDPYLAAVSMDGQFFNYKGQDFITDTASVVCSLESVTPKTYAEKLAVGVFKTLLLYALQD